MTLVLTGGPSSGKTTLTRAIHRAFEGQVAIVPEAASILFRGGFRRRTYPAGVKHQQRAIYWVQVEHEALYKIEHSGLMLVCDRGTIDGLAYLPVTKEVGKDDFLVSVGSTLAKEMQRYQWVIHLDTASEQHYDTSNEVRTESHGEADIINQRVRRVWDSHPQRFIIPAEDTFANKIYSVVSIVGAILAGHSYDQIVEELSGS